MTRYAFLAEWADPITEQIRKFTLCFYEEGSKNYVEMIDNKLKRMFLKKTEILNVSLQDIYIGAQVNVFSRQLSITDYADESTRKTLSNKQEHTLVLVKNEGIDGLGSVLNSIAMDSSLGIAKAKMTHLDDGEAQQLNGSAGGLVVAIDVVGAGAVAKVQDLFGSESVSVSENAANAQREITYIFDKSCGAPTVTMGSNSTLCLIKPHAVSKTGDILETITNNGYRITALQSFTLDPTSASEFLEVYKGVVPEYSAMISEFTAGMLIALEVTGVEGQTSFRKLCGPSDPEIARQIRPDTLRARYGADKIRNAVHCTDLADDTTLELEYFFKLLAEYGL